MTVGMEVTAGIQTIAGIMIIAGMTRVLAIALMFANAGRLDDSGKSVIAVRRRIGKQGAFATPRRRFCNARSRLPARKCLRMGDGFGPVGRVHFGMNHGYSRSILPNHNISHLRWDANCDGGDDRRDGLRAAPLTRVIATKARLTFLILSKDPKLVSH